MNYTENCRLPQWEETDRVLRTDFNDAFAALEVIGTDHAKLRSLARDLARDVYRREVQGRVCHGRGGVTNSMWVNALASREDAGGDGRGWNGRYGIRLGPGYLPTIEGVKATAKEEAFIITSTTQEKVSQRAAVTFTSDGYGTMETVTLWSHFHTSHTQYEYDFSITLTRLDTGETIKTAGPFRSQSSGSTNQLSYPEVNFPLEAGVPYRMAFELPNENAFIGEGGFGLAASWLTVREPIMTFAERTGSVVINSVVSPPEGTSEATGIVRWQGNGKFSLSLAGRKLLETQTRDALNAEGQPCQETELDVPELPDAPFSIKFDMLKGEGDFAVYDYGLIWK